MLEMAHRRDLGVVFSVVCPCPLVQAVGDVKECDVVVSQTRSHSLGLNAMQQGGPLKVNLNTQNAWLTRSNWSTFTLQLLAFLV